MIPKIQGLSGGAQKRFNTIYTALANANPGANPNMVARAALQMMQREGYVAIRDASGNVTVKKLTQKQIAQLQAQAANQAANQQQVAQRQMRPTFGLFPNIGDTTIRWRQQ